MATHSSILALEIPRTEESGGLQSTGSQRIRPTLSLCTAGSVAALRPTHSIHWVLCPPPSSHDGRRSGSPGRTAIPLDRWKKQYFWAFKHLGQVLRCPESPLFTRLLATSQRSSISLSYPLWAQGLQVAGREPEPQGEDSVTWPFLLLLETLCSSGLCAETGEKTSFCAKKRIWTS